MVRTVKDYSITPSSLCSQIVQNCLDQIDAASARTGARHAALFVQENVGRDAPDAVSRGDRRIRIVKIGKSELMAFHEFPGRRLRSVELRRADDVHAGVRQFVPVKGGDRGQLPRTVWSPGRPKRQKRGRAMSVAEVDHRPVQGLGLKRDALGTSAVADRDRSGTWSIGGQRPQSVRGWRRRVGGRNSGIGRRRESNRRRNRSCRSRCRWTYGLGGWGKRRNGS